jgi:hypothetical protein
VAATPGAATAAAGGAVTRTQHVSITIGAGDRTGEANFALVPGVPVRVAITNHTREFHTFTISALGLSALVRPAAAHAPRTTVVTFTPNAYGTLAWHCAICPSGAHGQPHAMRGMLYLIVDPAANG